MIYPIIKKTYNNVSIAESVSLDKVKISHLLILIHGTAVKATEAPKILINGRIMDENNQSRNVISGNMPLDVLGAYSDMLGGVGFNSTTDEYVLLPIGSRDLSDKELILDIKSSAALAANDLIMEISGLRLDDNMPALEYQYRSIPIAGITVPRCLCMYDVNTAYNSSVVSVITMENGSQLNIPHNTGFALAQATQKLESVNTFGIIYQDKDMEEGRKITIEPSAAFNAFILQLGLE